VFTAPIKPAPNAPTYQPSGMNVPLFGAGSTASGSGGFGLPSVGSIPENNPFSISGEHTTTRLSLKSRRRRT
jgi:hypothetical protein